MAARELDDILREVRRVQIQARRQVNDLLSGEYASAFKGRGMEFESVREYVPGDDIRTIDWNVTARSSSPFIKTFREERESTIVLAVDISASGAFGTSERSKLDLAIEVAAVLMFTAIRNNDKVGLLLFADDIVRYVPPRKGRGSVLRLIRELLTVEPIQRTTDIGRALQYLGRVHHRRCILFVLSDFISQEFSRDLAIANQRHECIAFLLRDPREESLPNVGWVALQDAETGEIIEIDSSSSSVRKWYAAQAKERDDRLLEIFRRAQVESLTLRTDRPYSHDLQRFFLARERARS